MATLYRRLVGWTFFRKLKVSEFARILVFLHFLLSLEKILEFLDTFSGNIVSKLCPKNYSLHKISAKKSYIFSGILSHFRYFRVPYIGESLWQVKLTKRPDINVTLT